MLRTASAPSAAAKAKNAIETIPITGNLSAARTTSRTTKAITPTSQRKVVFKADRPRLEATEGFIRSCIGWFALRFKHEAPQIPYHLELMLAALGWSHFLRLQNVEHQHSARDREDQFRHFLRCEMMRIAFYFRRTRDHIDYAIHRRLQNVPHQVGHLRIPRSFRIKIDNEGRDDPRRIF